ncbi:MAG: hypothetical protein HOP97_05255 [Terrabacter sp.]|nr:hypothetical protein [Dermatophilaceae bacterium]NUR17833.1 hypothetical protein [Dermatophilaceae bacterium]NUR80648.1 hypothetical protein [Dermatophilaceae bacterium]NUS41015.1 hypothetical protein [Terrabacter sp.]
MSEGNRGPGVADPATLRALTSSRAATRSMSEELLTHVPDLGDLPTQRALDAWVEQAADTLRALSEAFEERLLDVGSAGSPAAADSSDRSRQAGPG